MINRFLILDEILCDEYDELLMLDEIFYDEYDGLLADFLCLVILGKLRSNRYSVGFSSKLWT